MTATDGVKAYGAALLVLLAVACTAEQKIRCGEGTELVAGRCVPLDGGAAGGSNGVVCGDGAVVLDGQCQGLRGIGQACESGEQCASGSCLGEDRGAPGGYCTVPACSDNRPCPAGSRCYYSSTERQFLCLAYCDDPGDCRDGYACQPLYTSGVSVCAPSCVATQACPAGTRCDEASGTCVLHECELGASDACAGEDDAGASDLVCYADRLGLSASGAVCLPACDPSASVSGCADNEVCQPLPEDPARTGLCVPPICATTEECSPGAVCMDGVCQPPARCDDDGACEGDDLVCVGGAGGQCMPACPESGDEGCAELHSGLVCSAALGACLPTGSFPGSVCRSDRNAPCSELRVGERTVPMACEDNVCLARCDEGGSALCESIRSSLTCAEALFDAPLCVPKGSFPGGPCDGGSCAPLARGGQTLTMACAQDTCLVTCEAGAAGDIACAALDARLVCIDGAFNGPADLCLPRGSYPGGPCGPGGACGDGMTCQADRCLYTCAQGGEAFCNGVSAGLSCASGVYAEPVCLPRGSFPGSPCRPTGGDECDQNLGGLADADMICNAGRCVVQCEAPGIFASGDALCGAVSSVLTCVNGPGVDVCVIACGEGDACPAGSSCLTSQDACLPTGTFLGSPCAEGNACDGSPSLVCQPGAAVCVAGCGHLPEANRNGYCSTLGAQLGTGWNTCVDTDPGPSELLTCVDL